ncbi:MAG: CoA transferase [Gammaproteobacteria bacterium]|nr:CoA transferase [Gammaproteobacteria bacterium]MYF11491.1 CoA transferase [Gammaproteobacteria bacterium]MYH15644.1 CoA transferase [Gammaproteobacteria bacterium]MYK81026.1 CoA transferase [Gammaproteobacteria bacterium]
MSAPLEDIRVLEVDNYMAAPSAAAILADMGADVLKIEPITGDPMRGLSRPLKVESNFAEYDLQFDVDNRGKRSAAIALDKPEGQALVQRLAQDADVFLCNLLAQRQDRFGLDPETLFAANPRLVHATLTGYGTTGPDAWRPGYDVTAFFGRSGLSDAMREGVDGVVPRAGVAQGDHTTGLALVAAILAALRLAERTGEGQVVETSLYETAVWTQASEFSVTATDKAPVRRRARHEALTPMTNRYPCGDGNWVVLNMLDSGAWERLCRAIGREDWLADERYATGRDRYRHMPELVDGIDATLSAKTRDEWGAVFDEHGVIWGPVLGLHEVVDDPHADAIGLFPELQHPELGTYRTVNAPMRFNSADVRPRGPAPTVGEHTEQILREAGLSQPEIQALFDDGIVR